MTPGRVLDVSALVDIAVAKTRYSRHIVAMCLYRGGGLCVPSSALAAVYSIAPLDTQAELFDLLTGPGVTIDDLTAGKAPDIGELLDGANDVVAGHVVWCARHTHWPILTDRGSQLTLLDPRVMIDPIP
jgi:hypothetical protein